MLKPNQKERVKKYRKGKERGKIVNLRKIENAENILSWAEAMPGMEYLGYNRLYFRNGWFPRWFHADGNTCPVGNICENLSETEVEFLNSITEWLGEKWKNGCDWKMVGDLKNMDCCVGENLYLLKVEDAPCGCLIHFNTTYGNADYPVRVYLYREENNVL